MFAAYIAASIGRSNGAWFFSFSVNAASSRRTRRHRGRRLAHKQKLDCALQLADPSPSISTMPLTSILGHARRLPVEKWN